MTEPDQCRSPWNEGLGIPVSVVARDLYRLACIFHASQSIDDCGVIGLAHLRSEFQEAEAAHLLISLASVLRNTQDQNPERAEYWRSKLPSDEVGSLVKNLKADSKPVPLTFREACSKIIHCLTVNYEYVNARPQVGNALLPTIHLYGWYGKKEWKATVDINRFIDVAEYMNV